MSPWDSPDRPRFVDGSLAGVWQFAIAASAGENEPVRINLRDQHRRRQFNTEVDLQNPPAVVKPPQGDGAEICLQWDQAIDDQGHLRHCPACGCRELFARKDFPQVVGLLIMMMLVPTA